MLQRFREMLRQRSRREEVYSGATFWNDKATTHSGTAVSMFVNHALNERYQHEQFAFFDKSLGDVAGRRVLDVGCGTGRLSRHLAEQGATVFAFDFAQKAIDIARRESEGMSIEYRVASVFDVDMGGDDYDDIVEIACLSAACRTSEEFEAVLRKLHGALRPGGKLVLIEPFHRGFLHRVLRLSKAEAIAVMKTAGFEVFATRELHFWPLRLWLTLGETPVWITRMLYPVGETLLRLSPKRFGFGDYKGIAARRLS